MYSFLALSAGIAAVNVMPNFSDYLKYSSGFLPGVVPSLSVSDHATYLTGNIAVPTSAMNTRLNYPLPANQYVSREHFSSYSGVSQEEFLLRRRPLSNRFLSRHPSQDMSREHNSKSTQKKKLLTPHSRIDPSSPKQLSNSSKSPPPYPPKS
jgi:hypothetical protein